MLPVTKNDVVRHLRAVNDHTITEALRANPTLENLEAVSLRLAQEDDVLGEARKPLNGEAARIYDIVMCDPLYAASESEDM